MPSLHFHIYDLKLLFNQMHVQSLTPIRYSNMPLVSNFRLIRALFVFREDDTSPISELTLLKSILCLQSVFVNWNNLRYT